MTDDAKPKKKRKAKRTTRTKKKSGELRILNHPETGEEIVLQPYDEYPEVFKYVAKVMFISGSDNVRQIATKLNIPLNTIRTWQTRDGWLSLRREVNRLASQDAVRESRRSMSTYILEIDRGTNTLIDKLNERLAKVEDKDQVKSEAELIKLMYTALQIKLTIVRILNYGTESRGFTPHPADLQFDKTAVRRSTKLLTMNSAELILEDIPQHLRAAADFVLGVGDAVEPELLDALAKHIDNVTDDDEEEVEDKMLY